MRGESVTSTPSGGDAFATGSRVIEVRVAELRQLFNAIDPSPFRERDLDPTAEQFIVDWARDLPRDVPLELRVHLERCAGPRRRSRAARTGDSPTFQGERGCLTANAPRTVPSRSHQPLDRARIPVVHRWRLAISSGGSGDNGFATLLREGYLIGARVAMWRPLEVFLDRLVADLGGRPSFRPSQPDASTHRIQRGGVGGGVAVGLAGCPHLRAPGE